MKQTPKIVIPEDVIDRCFDCPFYEERADGYDGTAMYCRHPDAPDGFVKMNEFRFDTLEDTEIWVNCPLPDEDAQ